MQPLLVFGFVISVLCLFYPPLIGFCFGVAAFFVMSFVICKAIGG